MLKRRCPEGTENTEYCVRGNPTQSQLAVYDSKIREPLGRPFS